MAEDRALTLAAGDRRVIDHPGHHHDRRLTVLVIELDRLATDLLQELLVREATADDDDGLHLGHRLAGFILHRALKAAVDAGRHPVDQICSRETTPSLRRQSAPPPGGIRGLILGRTR